MPFTQIVGDTRMSIIKQTTARGAWEVKNLGVYIADTLNWSTHIEHRIEKAKKVINCLRKNVAISIKFSVKFVLYKSAILPIFLYGLNCSYQSRTDQRKPENRQRRVLKLVCGPHRGDYNAHLKLLNVLPLPHFIQLDDLLFLSKLYKHID